MKTTVPVASMGSMGPLSGAKCRPCRAACKGGCVEEVGRGWDEDWNSIEWRDGTLELCDGSGEWEEGWERVFDELAGEEAARARRRVGMMGVEECVEGWEELRGKAWSGWEAPSPEVVCGLGRLKSFKKKVL